MSLQQPTSSDITVDTLSRSNMLVRASNFMARTLFNQPSFGAFVEPFIQLAYKNWQVDGIRSKVIVNRQESGQVFTLVLKPESRLPTFKAGQYVSLTLNHNGSRHIRTFSISSSPEDYSRHKTIELSIRIQENGAITPWMAKHLIPGTRIHISPPAGEFVMPDSIQPLLMIAGGTGITPLRSMLRSITQKNDKRLVTLLYFGHDHLFKDELETIVHEHSNIEIHFVDTRRDGHINEAVIEKLCPDFQIRQAMICGPHPLIKASRDLLTSKGLDESDIHFEYFGAAPIEDLPFEHGGDDSLPTVNFSQSNTLVRHQSKKSLLEVAEDAGLKPVHGCRRGVCHQCVCQKESGVVYNTLTQQYSDTGPETIQLCISVPVTPTSITL